jgi:serine-protein kinase ATM
VDSDFGENRGIERSFQNSINEMFIDSSFGQFVDLLCRLSGQFDAKGNEDAPDMDFKHHRPNNITSASSLDENWAFRDIPRQSMTIEGWRVRLLVRLQTNVQFKIGATPSLANEHCLPYLEPQCLLLAGEQISKSIFGARNPEFGTDLLESFKTNIASTYDWGGNEMTASTAMDIISAYFAGIETIRSEQDLPDIITQLYRWAIKVVVHRELSSPPARIRAAGILEQAAHFDINFGKDSKSEGRAGVLLIKLMQDSDIKVKFHLANRIKSIFLSFPFVDRVDVYRDIVDSLESNEKFFEGFALRAFTLTQLTLASDDIRRAAMVNLLELGKFESSKLIVHSCFKHVAERLYQGDLANLFLQNSPQFISSWIDFDEDIFQFPFHVFGFPDFDSWSSTVESELVSQLVNAGRWDDAINLFRKSNPFENTLIRCLPRIVSYYHLIATTAPQMGSIPDRCQAALGSDNYHHSLTSRFAQCLAVMVERLDDKTFTGNAFTSLSLGTAASIFSAIDLPDLSPTYPEPQQPSFPVRKVLTAIENLRNALKVSSQHLWSASNTVFVIRNLIDQGVAASDPTVTLSFLRRIVFTLCIAGNTICEGYSLEMLVFGIKEFITRTAVCRETIQIIKYIFSLGSNYLVANPDRFRHMVVVLLPPIQTLQSDSIDHDFITALYKWLDHLVATTLPGREGLRATALLLKILTDRQSFEDPSTGEIIELLVAEDEHLWDQVELRRFALDLLSVRSDIFQEPPHTLSRLVNYFLCSGRGPAYSTRSRRWLGLAIGRISRPTNFFQPEYRLLSRYSDIQNPGDADNSCTTAIIGEIFKFIRSDSRIAGLLEQVLREMSSQRSFRISAKFGPDQAIMTHLSSPYINSIVTILPSLQFLPPSVVDAWILIDKPFIAWYKSLACAIAQHLPGQFFSSLVPSIDASVEFCKSVFPYLVDEYRSQSNYDGSVTRIFNRILQLSDSIERDYMRLIIHTLLFLRVRQAKSSKHKVQPLVDEIDYLHAANAAVACKMFKTALMFLEISSNNWTAASSQRVGHTLSEIYRNIDDPDLSYALSQSINRSWNELLEVYKLHHERERVSGLRRARLRGKVELGVSLPLEDEDMRAVAELIRQNGFPLKPDEFVEASGKNDDDGKSAAGVYTSAWRLGSWDLPPLARSTDSDTLTYAVLHNLVHSNLTEQFSSVLNSAITQVVDRLSLGFGSTENTKAVLCLSMFADITYLFSNSRPFTTVGRAWVNQILQNALYGR